MKKEISKGTQKFIWHLVAFVAVFVLVLVVLCRVLPEPSRTSTVDQNPQQTVSQTNENLSTDFDSVKERVDAANKTTGQEIKDLYSGEGKSTMQKQLETRLFFNTLKSVLICILLVVVVIILIKKGFNFRKVKKIFDEDDKTTDEDTPDGSPEAGEDPDDISDEEDTENASDEEGPDVSPEDNGENTSDDSSDDEEPPIVDPAAPDEQEVAENCKL